MPDSTLPSLPYDVVIVTKDRPDLLRYSIPSILGQSPAPGRLIIVDASRDHQRTVDVAHACHGEAEAATELMVIPHRPWQTAQRNEGLRHVTSPIVFIPDDDSILLPGAAEAVLRLYERDEQGLIGGVALVETKTPPPAVRSAEAARARRATLGERLIYRFSSVKARLLRDVAPNPMYVAACERLRGLSPPTWLEEADARVIPYMHGFRMTFRTGLVRACGFDEGLARGRGFDDYDITLKVLKTHLIVESRRGLVYHHRTGGKRDDALELGLTQLLNIAYITCRHAPPGSAPRKALGRYAKRLLVEYGLRAHSGYGRERLRGVRLARRRLPQLLNASADDLLSQYRNAFEQCREGNRRMGEVESAA